MFQYSDHCSIFTTIAALFGLEFIRNVQKEIQLKCHCSHWQANKLRLNAYLMIRSLFSTSTEFWIKSKSAQWRLFHQARLYLLSLFFTFSLAEAQTTLKMLDSSLLGGCMSRSREREWKKGRAVNYSDFVDIFSDKKLSTFPLLDERTTRWTAIFVEVDVHIRNVNPRVSISSAAHSGTVCGGEEEMFSLILAHFSRNFHSLQNERLPQLKH